MRSYQVFAAMTPERAVEVMRNLREGAPVMFRQAVDAAAVSIRTRPVYLRNQPFEKRAETIRRSLARAVANPVADEMLAIYFLQCRKELLVEWLDGIGLEHDEGTLEEDAPPQPKKAELEAAVKQFVSVDDEPDRGLLLAAFAAQESIEWPDLDAYIEGAAGTG